MTVYRPISSARGLRTCKGGSHEGIPEVCVRAEHLKDGYHPAVRAAVAEAKATRRPRKNVGLPHAINSDRCRRGAPPVHARDFRIVLRERSNLKQRARAFALDDAVELAPRDERDARRDRPLPVAVPHRRGVVPR